MTDPLNKMEQQAEPVAWEERHTMAAINATASFDTVRLTSEHGPYDISRPTFHCDRFVEAVVALRDAQWRRAAPIMSPASTDSPDVSQKGGGSDTSEQCAGCDRAQLLAAVECSLALSMQPSSGFPILAQHGFTHNPDLQEADYSQACSFVEGLCRAALKDSLSTEPMDKEQMCPLGGTDSAIKESLTTAPGTPLETGEGEER